MMLGVVMHACNLNTELRKEDSGFQATLGYIARVCVKKKKKENQKKPQKTREYGDWNVVPW